MVIWSCCSSQCCEFDTFDMSSILINLSSLLLLPQIKQILLAISLQQMSLLLKVVSATCQTVSLKLLHLPFFVCVCLQINQKFLMFSKSECFCYYKEEIPSQSATTDGIITLNLYTSNQCVNIGHFYGIHRKSELLFSCFCYQSLMP